MNVNSKVQQLLIYKPKYNDLMLQNNRLTL